jgi:lysophospholipase L1-like esterase
MLDENGAPKADLFLKDKLHMNRSGYDLWKETLKPFLIKSKSDSDLVTR